MSGELYLGVDGGATRSRARLRDAGGKLLAEATGSAANIHVDFDAAAAALRALVDATLTNAGLNPADYGSIAVGLGLAGFKEETTRHGSLRRSLALGASEPPMTRPPPVSAPMRGRMAGSSSRAPARLRLLASGTTTIIGGRGFALGDDGSGSHIGLDAMRSAMRAYDQIGPESALTQDLISHFNNDSVAMMNWALQAKPGDFGGFAPRVFEHAARHDPIALEIIRDRGPSHRRAHARRGRAWRRAGLVGRWRGRSLAPAISNPISPRGLSRRCTTQPMARSCSLGALWRRNGKSRHEGFLRRAHLRRRVAARRLCAHR